MSHGLRIEGVQELRVDRSVPAGIRLFVADLDEQYQQSHATFPLYLPDSELRESERFKTARLRHRFLASRYLLKRVLAEVLDQPADQLRIERPNGEKPYLRDAALSFNLSHSKNFFALGISKHGEIGVDIEAGISLETAREVAPRVLGPQELMHWGQLAGNSQTDAFARYWTMKESILKAVGEGLGRDPREIEVTIDEEDPRFLTLPLSYAPATDWRMGFVDTGWPRTRLAYALRLEKS